MTPRNLQCALPARHRAGDALSLSLQTGLPAGTTVFFILSAVIDNAPTRQRIGGTDGVAVDSNGLATITLASTDTAAWAAARYDWVLFAVDASSNRTQLAQGRILVQPDPAGASPVDTRTRDERILANIRALLEGKFLDDVSMYKIGGRELTKMSPTELVKLEAIYARKCSRRRVASVPLSFGGRR